MLQRFVLCYSITIERSVCMILVDKSIKERVAKGELIVENYNDSNLNSISYDLTLESIVSTDASLNSYDLHPGESVFIQTKEKLSIPYDVLGRIAQKNSRMRMGLYVDGPHYHPGHVTFAYLRVQNISANILTLKKGDKIAQIIFEQLVEVPEHPYEGPEATYKDEFKYKGLGDYKEEYEKSIKAIQEAKEDLETKETQIYANVLTLMGIVAAVFGIITINFQAFGQATFNIKLLLTMNLSLVFTIAVFFGLLHIITNYHVTSKVKNKSFMLFYAITLALIFGALLIIYSFL